MLKNKVAIVTGASSGIGKAVSIALAGAGIKVALAARRLDKLAEVEAAIKKNGGTAISIQTDVTDRKQVKNMVQVAESKLGPVDILVNNAGIWYYTWMKSCMEEEWDKTIDVNIKGLTNCIGAVLDGMVKRGQGHIVNMSSENGRKPIPGLAVYTGSKFYVEGLSQTMRLELKDKGVKITCIQPGDVALDDTPINHSPDKDAQDADMTSTFKVLDTVDIANAVLYAVSQPENVAVNELLIQPRSNPV